MKVLALDFETYWDKEFTLKKMTTDAYVLDPRFKVHMMGLRDTAGKIVVFNEREIPYVLARINWADTAILCHNTAFDGFILQHHYKTPSPKLWLDTLSMARPIVGNNSRHSLDALARHFDLPPKGDELALTCGVRDLSPAVFERVSGYCANDVFLNWAIFERLAPGGGHATLPAHRVLLVEHGIYIIEALDLEELAREDRHEFTLVLIPLNIYGATGSPVRPLAVFAA